MLRIEQNLYNSISRGIPTPVSEFEGKLPPAPSENWERIALAQCLVNYYHSNGKVGPWTPNEVYQWLIKQPLWGTEDFARVYAYLNIMSMVVMRAYFDRLKFPEAVTFCDTWLRAIAGYMTLGCGWGTGKDVNVPRLLDNLAIGRPQLVHGTLPPSKRHGEAPFLTWAGDRSFTHDGLGYLGATIANAWIWSIIGRDSTYLRVEFADEFSKLLASKNLEWRLITMEESEVCAKALNNDLNALKTIISWCKAAPMPNDSFVVLRRSNGVEWARLGGSKAPTASLDYCSWSNTGDTRFMAANDGYRKGGPTGSYIRPSAVEVIGDYKAFKAYCVDKPVQNISCDALSGDIQFGVLIDKEGIEVFNPLDEEDDMLPSTVEHWVSKATNNKCVFNADPTNGFFSTISKLNYKNDYYILRKSDGKYPFATETLFYNREKDEIEILNECSYDIVTGELLNVRTFWANDGVTPGITWLRNDVPTMRVSGYLVEHPLADRGRPYIPPGQETPIEIGSYYTAKVEAEASYEYRRASACGEQMDIIRRTDRMGAAPQNIEVYDIGVGSGSYGYIYWETRPRGVFHRSAGGVSISTPREGCAAYILTKEGYEGWAYTIDMPKDKLPVLTQEARKPQLVAKEKKQSFFDKILEFFKKLF